MKMSSMPLHISTVNKSNHTIPVSFKAFPPRQFHAVFSVCEGFMKMGPY